MNMQTEFREIRGREIFLLTAKMCDRCNKKQATVHRCPGDGSLHHHGGIHRRQGGSEVVCDDCFLIAESEWQALRKEGGL